MHVFSMGSIDKRLELVLTKTRHQFKIVLKIQGNNTQYI